MSQPNDRFSAVKSGLLEFAVLAVLNRNEAYVADIIDRLAKTEFRTQEGTLYPLLSRLRREGSLEYEWRESDAGPPRKYYHLTPRGKEELRRFREYWKKIITTIQHLGTNHG
ncbi:MAG: PadR family transcriptional regulator [Patescibacteria group bacterium]|nr:PadR family transcriptional regulator [Patescibacteria group bacterium]